MRIIERESRIESHGSELDEFSIDEQLIGRVREDLQRGRLHAAGDLEFPAKLRELIAALALAFIPDEAGA